MSLVFHFFISLLFSLTFANDDKTKEGIIEEIPPRPAIDQPNSKSTSQLENVRAMGIFFCQIPKNGQTIMKIILCDLYRYFKGIPFKIYFGHGKSHSTQKLVFGECESRNWYKDLVETKFKSEKWQRNTDETKIAVIRHPMTRFVSLYIYFCERIKICGNEPNVHKFANEIYSLLSTRSVQGTSFDQNKKEIVEYHAQPQSWFCNLSVNPEQFQLIHNDGDRLETRNELLKAFEAAKVPKIYSDQVLFHVVYSDTTHTNRDENHTKNIQKSVEENPQTMAYFNAIYGQDFELFGYSK